MFKNMMESTCLRFYHFLYGIQSGDSLLFKYKIIITVDKMRFTLIVTIKFLGS